MVKNKYAVLDVFAGPGGLKEGFVARNKNFGPFVSIEKDKMACKTLSIRKVFHLIKNNKKFSKINYLDLIKNKSSFDKILNNSDNSELKELVDLSIWNHELGTDSAKKTFSEIRRRFKDQGWSENKKGNELILIGGPPCQAYSIAGRSRRSKMQKSGEYTPELDERNFLYERYLELVVEFKPSIFIMENVPGMLSSKINGKPVFSKVLKDLSNPSNPNKDNGLKYNLFPIVRKKDDLFIKDSDFKINSEDFGVPQSRKRVIIFGIRSDLGLKKVPNLESKPKINIEQILEGLPVLRSGITKRKNLSIQDEESIWKEEIISWNKSLLNSLSPELKEHLNKLFRKIKKKKFINGRGGEFLKKKQPSDIEALHSTVLRWIIDSDLDYHLNSTSRAHMDSDLKRYIFNSAFAEIKHKAALLPDYPDKLQPNHKSKKTSHQDRFRTLLKNKPSNTITSHIAKDGHAYIHPDPTQCRSITVREAARIQTFPDNYFFAGNRTQQYTQVGNAVPPYLAYQISNLIVDMLNT